MRYIVIGVINLFFGCASNVLHTMACKPVLGIQNLHTLCRPFEANVITGFGTIIILISIWMIAYESYKIANKKWAEKEAKK